MLDMRRVCKELAKECKPDEWMNEAIASVNKTMSLTVNPTGNPTVNPIANHKVNKIANKTASIHGESAKITGQPKRQDCIIGENPSRWLQITLWPTNCERLRNCRSEMRAHNRPKFDRINSAGINDRISEHEKSTSSIAAGE